MAKSVGERVDLVAPRERREPDRGRRDKPAIAHRAGGGLRGERPDPREDRIRAVGGRPPFELRELSQRGRRSCRRAEMRDPDEDVHRSASLIRRAARIEDRRELFVEHRAQHRRETGGCCRAALVAVDEDGDRHAGAALARARSGARHARERLAQARRERRDGIALGWREDHLRESLARQPPPRALQHVRAEPVERDGDDRNRHDRP